MKSSKKFSGLRIRTVNIIFLSSFIILCSSILISTFECQRKYNTMFLGVTDYSECTKAISYFKDASDYLTNQARFFAIHKDASFLKNYFDEQNTVKRREKSLEVLEMSHKDDETIINLRNAMDESKTLTHREHYSMKLICSADPEILTELPEEIQEIRLTREDKKLTPDEMMNKAQSILFDAVYNNSKDRILKYTESSLASLSKGVAVHLQSDDLILSKIFFLHKIISVLLIIISIVLYIIIYKLVISPLKENIDCIKLGEKMNVLGSYELRYIAKIYNELCEKNSIKENVLKHKAEHDPLTDLINREAFDQIKAIFKKSDEQIAYLLIDIDFFKNINDTYGHLVGDSVLKKIAKMLSEHFRNTDYVARVGGDEFAVIMTKFGEAPEVIIQRKIEGLNKKLQMVIDGLPPVSLSVGVSFSDSGFKDVQEEQSDKALYRVKNGGRCNCSFYDYIEIN
ncbi:MAG: GGDEF domain-containing protein [Treponema sp.]|nr:GGDEF domain-containing protein [Treponema sp.]